MTKTVPASALAALEQRLGHQFASPVRLVEALTHRSVAARSQGAHAGAGRRRHRGPVVVAGHADTGNERLEFLGDRVLGLLVAEMLLETFPTESEGEIARRHAELVRKETLAEVAGIIDLAPLIRLAPEEDQNVRNNASLLADACEAVIAALYLDGGLAPARRFVVSHWSGRMTAALSPPKDPKTGLQEWAQGRGKPLPAYRLIQTKGPPHQPVFTVEVAVEGEAAERADGLSKRIAEREAAAALLARLKGQVRE
jgi:ribonuclease III